MIKAVALVALIGPLAYSVVYFGPYLLRSFNAFIASQETVSESSAIEFLKIETLAELTTTRITLQSLTQWTEQMTVLGVGVGEESVIAWATVRIDYGVDLASARSIEPIQPDDLPKLILPEPEIQGVYVDPETLRFLRSATISMRYSDEDEAAFSRKALASIEEAAKSFAQDNGLLPSKAEIEQHILQLFEDMGVLTIPKIEWQAGS